MASGDITRQLIAAREGGAGAMDELYRMVYDRLRRIARGQLGRGGTRIVLDTTALVHEAYLKLVDHEQTGWKDRDHFFAVAARAMRQILVDHVRTRLADKRGGGAEHAPLNESRYGIEGRVVELLELDAALNRLERLDPRLCRVVELRFFCGLTGEETAQVLGVDPRTVKRDWRKARAFLFDDLGQS